MKQKLFSPLAILWLLAIIPLQGCSDLAQSSVSQSSNATRISVYFSPKGGATEALVKEIDGAKNEILVQAYSMTSKPVVQALVNAQKRGVNVQIILDRGQRNEKNPETDFLALSRMATYFDSRHAVAHNNCVIIDSSVLMTGSLNFTKGAADNNAESLLVIRGNRILVSRYIQNFELHRSHSELYKGQAKRMEASRTR